MESIIHVKLVGHTRPLNLSVKLNTTTAEELNRLVLEKANAMRSLEENDGFVRYNSCRIICRGVELLGTSTLEELHVHAGNVLHALLRTDDLSRVRPEQSQGTNEPPVSNWIENRIRSIFPQNTANEDENQDDQNILSQLVAGVVPENENAMSSVNHGSLDFFTILFMGITLGTILGPPSISLLTFPFGFLTSTAMKNGILLGILINFLLCLFYPFAFGSFIHYSSK